MTFVALLSSACQPQPAREERPPLVLISIDTLRSDHLPAYGYDRVATPAIDALRRDAILYERAYSHTPLTLPSHSSILSGLLPTEHGVRDNVGYVFDGASHPPLAALLKQAGYETGAAVSTYVLRRATGIASGFDFYEDSLEFAGNPSLGEIQRPGGETAAALIEWIKPRAARPFFAFLHLYEPHMPYTPPEPYKTRYAGIPYDGEIATSDAIVGRFLDELKRLGAYDRAAIVVLSDHGEGLGDHGEQQHGIFLYRETLQVPLLVKLPSGRRGGESVARPVGLIDIAPTVLELAKVAAPPAMSGQSLLGSGDERRTLYSETEYPRLHLGWSDLSSVIDGEFHFILGPDPELYALGPDRAERRNLVAVERRVVGGMLKALDRYTRAPAPPNAEDAEAVRKLAALGYLAGAAAARPGALPDPKSQSAALADVESAMQDLGANRADAAVVTLRRLVTANPNMADMWGYLGGALRSLGRGAEAVDALDRALELSGGLPSPALAAAEAHLAVRQFAEARRRAELALGKNSKGAYELLVRIAVARGDSTEALVLMRRATEEDAATPALRRQFAARLAEQGEVAAALDVLRPLAGTSDPAVICTTASVLSDAGRNSEAEIALRALLARDGGNARAHELLGTVMLRTGRAELARGELRQAVARQGGAASAWNTLGVALFQLGDAAGAVEAWERSVGLDGRQFEALFNLGLVEGGAGRSVEAAVALRRFIATAPPGRFADDIRKAREILRALGT
ncbi:MAG: sulfatase-like hydrolase/transferase [Acidobacteriota bacterium]